MPTFDPIPQLRFCFRNIRRLRRLDRRFNFAEIAIRAAPSRFDRGEIVILLARELHQLARLHQPQKQTSIFVVQRAADRRLLLDEFIPQIVIIGDQFEPCRKTKTMTVPSEQLHTKRVDRSEERAAKRVDRFQRQAGFKNAVSRALLHFVRGAVRVGDDNQLGQPLCRALWIFRNLDDPIRDRARFARTGGSDYREIRI